MKKTASVLAVVMIAMSLSTVNAAPQRPKSSPSYGQDDGKNATDSTPVGTATALMLALGGTALGYKLHKNKKDDK